MPAIRTDPDHGTRHDLPAGANDGFDLHPHRPGPPRWLARGHSHEHVQVRAELSERTTRVSTEACAGRGDGRGGSVVFRPANGRRIKSATGCVRRSPRLSLACAARLADCMPIPCCAASKRRSRSLTSWGVPPPAISPTAPPTAGTPVSYRQGSLTICSLQTPAAGIGDRHMGRSTGERTWGLACFIHCCLFVSRACLPGVSLQILARTCPELESELSSARVRRCTWTVLSAGILNACGRECYSR